MNHVTYDGVTTPTLEIIALQKPDAVGVSVVTLEAVLDWCERLARRTNGQFGCGWPHTESQQTVSRWWATLRVAPLSGAYEDKGAYCSSEASLDRAALIVFIAASEYAQRRAEVSAPSRPS